MKDIVIIGCGTAGMTAALYALRAGSSVMLLESESFGGQISYTPRVQNYPGIIDMSGADFSATLFDQVVQLGASYDLCEVLGIEKIDGGFRVLTDGESHECKSVVIATGVKPRRLGLDREDELVGGGVCYCAVCDGAFYAGETVAVCGGGNSALTDALLLSKSCKNVYLIHRGDSFRAEKPLIDEVLSKDNVEVLLNSTVTRLVGQPLSSVEIAVAKATEDNKKAAANNAKLEVAALFVAVGHEPNNSKFTSIVKLDKSGFIAGGEDCLTSCEGIFVAGDCRSKQLRQLTTAVADGSTAGLAASKFASKNH